MFCLEPSAFLSSSRFWMAAFPRIALFPKLENAGAIKLTHVDGPGDRLGAVA